MRPDRPAVVADRVEPVVVGRQRPDAPAREQPLGHQLVGDDRGTLLGHDPGPQELPDVRGQRVDRALVAVEPDRVVATPGVDPEVALEALAQGGGLEPKAGRERRVGERPVGKLRDSDLGVVDVALDLGRGDRQDGHRSVGEQDAVERVAPALVAEPLRRAGPVLDIAVAVAVAELVDPGQRGHRVVAERAHDLRVARPAPVLGQQDQPERRRVGAAVVRAVRLEPELGQLAHPQLVQDLARLHVPEVVALGGLEVGEGQERALAPAADRRPPSERP